MWNFKLTFLLLALFLGGCKTQSVLMDQSLPPVPINLPAPPAGIYNIQLILLDTLKGVREACKMDQANLYACSIPPIDLPDGTTTRCVVYMHRFNFNPYVLHEVRHCTNRYWHGRKFNTE